MVEGLGLGLVKEFPEGQNGRCTHLGGGKEGGVNIHNEIILDEGKGK